MQPLLCSHLSTANRTMDTPPLNDMDLISTGKIDTSKCVTIIYLYCVRKILLFFFKVVRVKLRCYSILSQL